MGTFTYDIRSGGGVLAQKQTKILMGCMTVTVTAKILRTLHMYPTLSYLLLNDTRIKVNQVKASSGETALLLASKLNHTEIVK